MFQDMQKQKGRGNTAVVINSAKAARPEWGGINETLHHFGICRSVAYRLISEGKIKTVSLREKGKTRGKRLVNLDSVALYLESLATGGEDQAQ